MTAFHRRELFRRGTWGLAALGAGGLVLRAGAEPTEPSGELGAFGELLLAERGDSPLELPDPAAVTEDNILGPYYRDGAPYRAKITPPLEPGDVLLIRGRVWGYDSRKPLAHARLDIWQANADGRYDNDDPRHPPAIDVFKNRARLISGEDGYYEFETIHPGAYRTGPEQWRPSHIHYMVQRPGYKKLVTQLYFEGDPHNATDPFIKKSLIIDPAEVKTDHGAYKVGDFDIVLAKV